MYNDNKLANGYRIIIFSCKSDKTKTSTFVQWEIRTQTSLTMIERKRSTITHTHTHIWIFNRKWIEIIPILAIKIENVVNGLDWIHVVNSLNPHSISQLPLISSSCTRCSFSISFISFRSFRQVLYPDIKRRYAVAVFFYFAFISPAYYRIQQFFFLSSLLAILYV